MQRRVRARLKRAAVITFLISNTSLSSPMAFAQSGAPAAADMTIDAKERKSLIDELTRRLDADYVYPERAKKIDEALHRHEKRGDYEAVTNAQQFADLLTSQMQQVVPDKHLYVQYSADELPPEAADGNPSPEEHAAEVRQMKVHNYGIDRIERLPFNIGYLSLEVFLPARDAGEALTQAMNLLANTDALIIDLRDNHGGDPNTVALLASYLFDGRTHLNDFYHRKGDRSEQMWTSEYVPGPRFGQNKDVYILMSGESVSAAEDFAYDLQALKRAVIVGQTSGGAANSGDEVRLDAHFSTMVPDSRSINPVTKTNWEGVGVKPDIAASAADAFRAAQIAVLNKMKAEEKNPSRLKRIEARIVEVEGEHGERGS